MSLKLFGWLLILSSMVPFALLFHELRQRVLSRKLSRPALYNGQFAGFGSRLKRFMLRDRTIGTLKVATAAFFVVAGAGAAHYHLGGTSAPTSAGEFSDPLDPDAADGELAQLASYARSVSADAPSSSTAEGKQPADANALLPDVNTMIERLASRLQTAPDDIQGWRTLGWSYVNTGRYQDAANAYEKAAALDPGSPEIKRLYEEAKAKANGDESPQTAAALRNGSIDEDVARNGETSSVPAIAEPEPATPHTTEAAIRSMVDGLADRLDNSPRDVEGWTNLMRSRVVLGERAVAATAFRKALDIFKDDAAASSSVTAAAVELGLKDD